MIAVIRLRGKVKKDQRIEDTLQMLNLHSVYNCTVIPEKPSYQGMLEKVKDQVTWGEINKETLTKLIRKRSESEVDAEETAEQIMSGEKTPKEAGLERKFRLHPPKGGFKGKKKKPIGKGGELGYRGKEINQLLERMI